MLLLLLLLLLFLLLFLPCLQLLPSPPPCDGLSEQGGSSPVGLAIPQGCVL